MRQSTRIGIGDVAKSRSQEARSSRGKKANAAGPTMPVLLQELPLPRHLRLPFFSARSIGHPSPSAVPFLLLLRASGFIGMRPTSSPGAGRRPSGAGLICSLSLRVGRRGAVASTTRRMLWISDVSGDSSMCMCSRKRVAKQTWETVTASREHPTASTRQQHSPEARTARPQSSTGHAYVADSMLLLGVDVG